MQQQNKEWLPHLNSDVMADARGPELDAYVVALEGWRRGLTLRWHVKDSQYFKEMKTWFVDRPGKLFSLSNGDKTHYFFRTRGDKVPNTAVEIGMDKQQTKQHLKQANISMPEGAQFTGAPEEQQILDYADEIGYPVVIKPTDGSFGRGVMINIQSRKELKDQLVHVRETLGYQDVIVEQYIPGLEYRLYIVADEVVGAMNRVPANVVGDGIHTIKTLIDLKNNEREQNPRLISCPIQLNSTMMELIHNKGYTSDTILEEGRQLFLSDLSNISTGGDPISVGTDLPEAVCDTAVRALKAVPGLEHGAVDLIIDERKPADEAATILELNPTSQIGGLLFPMAGPANDVPAAIIDYYFPETKGIKSDETNLYFDFTDILYPLLTRSATTTMVTPYPQGPLYTKKYTLKGDVQNIGFHRGLRKQAFERKLNGLVLNLENGDTEVVVSGVDPDMVDDFENALWEDPERSDVHEVHVSEWHGPIKIGFEIKADLKTQVEELKQLEAETRQAEARLKKAEQRFKKLNQSASWRVTAPIRMAGFVVKKIKRTNQ